MIRGTHWVSDLAVGVLPRIQTTVNTIERKFGCRFVKVSCKLAATVAGERVSCERSWARLPHLVDLQHHLLELLVSHVDVESAVTTNQEHRQQ